jgi:hypothetical protein
VAVKLEASKGPLQGSPSSMVFVGVQRIEQKMQTKDLPCRLICLMKAVLTTAHVGQMTDPRMLNGSLAEQRVESLKMTEVLAWPGLGFPKEELAG